MKLQDIPSALSAIADEGRFRRVEDLRMVTASRGIRRDGKEYIVFNSNDYLGMTHEGEVMVAARRSVIYGTGSGGARLTSGAVFELSELEKALAAFKHAEDAVIFNTGYMTNLGVLYALAGKGDVIFSDALNHASIVDGCRISKARVVIYAHSDMEDLARLLTETPCEGQRFIVTDGVFSMDGDICPLPSLLSLKKKYEACLIVDDAHGVGVIGDTGRGTAEYYHERGIDIQVGTLSKSLGAEGGFEGDHGLSQKCLPPLHLLHLDLCGDRGECAGGASTSGRQSFSLYGAAPLQYRLHEGEALRGRHSRPSGGYLHPSDRHR